mgnify:CR=1 FL=1
MSQQQALAQAIDPVLDAISAQVKLDAPTWYAINMKEGADEAEIIIYDEIGYFGISANKFINDLRAIKTSTINVRLNSPGGEVFDGTAIHNGLRSHGAKVVVHVEGVAASAASFIAMAGDEVRMADNAYLMIHNAWGGVMGDADDVRTYADMLEKINDNIAGMYQRKAGKNRKHWRALMDAETWFNAAEAKAEGLVDAVYESGAGKARAANNAKFLAVYNKIPDPVRQMWGHAIQAKTESPASGEDAPAQTKEPENMADNSIQSPPAPTPAAANEGIPQEIARINEHTRQQLIENGKKLGIEEGRSMEFVRMQKLIEAAPGRLDLVVDAFVNRQEPGALALAFKAAQSTAAAAAQAAQERDLEIARLQSIIATGGHAGVSQGVVSDAPDTDGFDMDPETRADMEWDSKPAIRAQFGNNKRRYTLYRVNQLKGGVRVLKTA